MSNDNIPTQLSLFDVEVWRSIPFVDDYAVSDLGRIMRTTDGVHTYAGRILMPTLAKTGYYVIRIRVDGVRKILRVHTLVMRAFVGGYPQGLQIHHRNGVKTDNRLENLEYVTASENTSHAYRTGLTLPLKGERCPASRLTQAQVNEIRSLYDMRAIPVKEIAKRFNITPNHASEIGRRKVWKG